MKKLSLITVAALLSLLAAPALRADEASHLKAAEDLLVAAQMEEIFAKSIDQALDQQLEANPKLAEVKEVMQAFFNKYMSWGALKSDMAKLYVESFSEQELLDITKFYQTPSGKKVALTTPLLMSKGASLGQKRVQEHLPELQAAIAATLEKKAVE